MTKSHPTSIFLQWTLLTLVVLVDSTFGCNRHADTPVREHKSNYHYHFHDPEHREYLPLNHKHRNIFPADKVLIPESELTAARSSCGKTLWTNIRDYPLEEINRAVDRARSILRPGGTIIAFQRNGISFRNFTSQYDTFWYGEKAPEHRFVDRTNDCKEQISTIYPQEGYSRDDGKIYYIVNVPTMYRGLTSMKCESNRQMCIQGNDISAVTRSCQQMYRKEQLLVLPINKYYFDVEDFELKSFYIPTGCACIPSS